MIKKIVFLITLMLITAQIIAQPIDGSSDYNKKTIMNQNNISLAVFNSGSICPFMGVNVEDFFYWNGLRYLLETGFMAAAEVVNENGDTLHIVSDSHRSTYNQRGDYDWYSDDLVKWGWLPREGYAKPDQDGIASSINPNTWPAEWTEWPGEYGDGITVGLNELYYVMDDFSNAEFPFYPFADTTKRGLGVSAEVRIYQFGSGMRDALILKYKLTNESPKDLNKMFLGFQSDPTIGAAGDLLDDRIGVINGNGVSGYEGSAHTIYLFDNDMIGNGGKQTGFLSFKLLGTPNFLGLTSTHALPWSGSDFSPADDELMWQLLTGDIDSSSTLFNSAGDNVVNFGSGPFSLASGEQTEMKLAIFLSEDFMDMIKDADYIYYHHNWGDIGDDVAMSDGSNNYQVSLDEPSSSVNGIVDVTWQYSGTDPNAVAAVEYSSNFGEEWIMLDKNLPINSNYQWNTANYRDGVNYLLRVIAYDLNEMRNYYYDICNSRFTIDNPTVNAQPELSVDLSFTQSPVFRSPLQISWTCEDADDENLSITLEYYYLEQGPFNLIDNEQYTNGSFNYYWDISNIPNNDKYKVKLIVSDGNSDSTITSNEFELNQLQASYPELNITQIAGNGTPQIIINVADSTSLTGDEYEVTFDVSDEENKTFSIKNNNNGILQVDSYPLLNNLSTPQFEGLKVKVFDKELAINTELSRYNRSVLDTTILFIRKATIGTRESYRGDWAIAFNDLDTASDGSYIFPGDTTTNQTLADVICPFRIVTLPEFTEANYIIVEEFATPNGKWDEGDMIVLQPDEDPGYRTTYEIKLDFSSGIQPGSDDTLFIQTDKPVKNDDVFRFTPDDSFVTSVKDNLVVSDYHISQNYPNPFNPTTKINYQLPKAGIVNIVVYDILGRKVQSLLNEYRNEGKYTLEFDASKFASGMYIYSLQVNGFVMNRKMMLLK